MTTRTMKTDELSGLPLDYAVARVLDLKPCEGDYADWLVQSPEGGMIQLGSGGFNPSADFDDYFEYVQPLLGGNAFAFDPRRTMWWVRVGNGVTVDSVSLKECGCRALVYGVFGKEIEIPEALL